MATFGVGGFMFCPVVGWGLVGAMTPHRATNPLITLTDVTVSYGRHVALDGINGTFERGTLTAVLGPNGGGKSSFLKALLGLCKIRSGTIHYNGIRPRDMAYLPQQSMLDRSFPLRVYDAVALGLCQEHGFWADLGKLARAHVMTALNQVGMADYADRSLDSLSGGQFGRVLFARLALQKSSVILLDEPFAAIDPYTIDDLVGVLHAWHRQGRTLIVVSHDLDLVKDHFPNAVLLAQKVIAWADTPSVVTDQHFKTAREVSRTWEWEE